MGPKSASTATKSKPKPSHPTYQVMISHAIAALKERTGSSQPAIIKYIEANYNVGDSDNFKRQLRLALKRLLKDGVLVQIKASYKLSEEGKKVHKAEAGVKPAVTKPAATKKPATKKPAAASGDSTPATKKPVVKKPIAKKPIAKKPAAPKSAVSKKNAAKKPVVKKPAAKKPAAKKPAAAKK